MLLERDFGVCQSLPAQFVVDGIVLGLRHVCYHSSLDTVIISLRPMNSHMDSRDGVKNPNIIVSDAECVDGLLGTKVAQMLRRSSHALSGVESLLGNRL